MQIKLYKYAGFECLGNNLYKHCDFLGCVLVLFLISQQDVYFC